jgi:xylulose-5-phosphate/fructose-6-phosphate phosphoketolase
MSANPIANGGLVRKPLDMPYFRDSAVEVKKPGATLAGNAPTLGNFLRAVMRVDMDRFRVFGPDETQSNRLEAIYEVAKKVWMAEYFPEDSDGGELAPNGRVMEILSEHTVEGWLEGYILSGRHGLLNSYEPFIHVIDSMFNQHAKWLEKCNELPWRANVSSLNLLITALVWRQDHNGFTHQDPASSMWSPTRAPRCQVTGAGVREALLNQKIAAKSHAHEFGVDPQDITNWQWPF